MSSAIVWPKPRAALLFDVLRPTDERFRRVERLAWRARKRPRWVYNVIQSSGHHTASCVAALLTAPENAGLVLSTSDAWPHGTRLIIREGAYVDWFIFGADTAVWWDVVGKNMQRIYAQRDREKHYV